MEETRKIIRSSSSGTFPTPSLYETEEVKRLEDAGPFCRAPGKKRLSKQLSMIDTPRDIAWQKRRRQRLQQERTKSVDLTDEDLNELKGSIELGFGFNEEEGQRLCHTLPALDLYFAVNRQYSPLSNSPNSTPGSAFDSSSPGSFPDRSTPLESPGSESATNNSWMICCPGDDPQQVKMKLKHWAQAVACSVLQSH